MVTINENVAILSVDVNNWGYDEEDNEYPVAYEASIRFFGHELIMHFSVDDLRDYKNGEGLRNIGLEGDSDLFDSMDAYFEKNDEAAKMLAGMSKEAWDLYYGDNTPYDYLGNKQEEEER